MKPARSLQIRLTLSVLAVVVVFWLGALGLSWYEARHDLEELLDAHLEQAAALLMLQAPPVGAEPQVPVVPPTTLPRYTEIAAIQVFDHGRLVLRSDNAPPAPMFELPPGRDAGFAFVTIGGVEWRVYSVHDPAVSRRVLVGERLKSRTDILDALLHSGAIPMLLALPLLAIAVWSAVRQAIAPMRRMDALLRERRPQALDPIALDDLPPELAPLLGALNGLLGRIQTLIDTERRFTADAAHELRTPIAAIRVQAQVALGEADDARRRHALTSTIAGCDRAARLVEQLLTLSRLEATAALPLGTVDLSALVEGIVAELAPLAEARQQRIELHAPAACAVRGDSTLLSVLVRNLVDNAIRYSPPNATIEFAVTVAAERVHLALDDSGPGISDADLQRLGERFFRVIGSGQSGSGLGWSIARRAAEAHGATLRVQRSGRLGGLRVELALTPA
jgi:two-component system sensor histidine kinase QseC